MYNYMTNLTDAFMQRSVTNALISSWFLYNRKHTTYH